MTTILVSRGVNRRFGAMTKRHGCRIYRLVGEYSRSKEVAARTLMKAMIETDAKRGIVVFLSDWHGPQPVLWVNK